MTAASRRKLIICLDTSLLIIFLLLLSPRMTGLALHEALGIIFFIPLIIHLLVSWAWITNLVRKFLKATLRAKVNFILNSILFILMITEIVSGILISQAMLPAFGIKTINDGAWRAVHNITLNFTVLFGGLHIAINWKWIVSALKKRVAVATPGKLRLSPKFMTLVLRTGILICVTGIVALLLYGIVGKPSVKRLYRGNEIERFTPMLWPGIRQFLGEGFIIAVYVLVARRVLRIRL